MSEKEQQVCTSDTMEREELAFSPDRVLFFFFLWFMSLKVLSGLHLYLGEKNDAFIYFKHVGLLI